jgi:hypothetical protein
MANASPAPGKAVTSPRRSSCRAAPLLRQDERRTSTPSRGCRAPS